MPLMILRCARQPVRAVLSVLTLFFAATGASQAAVEISAKPTSNMACSGGVCKPTAKKAVLNVNDLAQMLASANVTVKSTSRNQDIKIDAKLEWDSTRLTLDAYRSIAFNESIAVSGNGGLTITTSAGGSGGDFQFFKHSHVKFSDIHSNLTINGNRYALAKTIGQIKRLIHGGHGGEQYIALAEDNDAAQYRAGIIQFDTTVLEGLGNVISNLTINDNTDQASIGLFAVVATVRDLGLENVNVTGTGLNQRVGAIAGESYGPIINCYSTGKVSATGEQAGVGGLVGESLGTVANSHSDASVSGTSSLWVGGLLGASGAGNQGQWKGAVQHSYSTGTVIVSDGAAVGGLVGRNLGGAIDNSYAIGAVTGGSNSFGGGLIGENANSDSSSPTISTSYSTGAVSGGSGAMIGGLIGEDLVGNGLTNTYWDLDTSGIGDSSQGAGNIQNDPGITGLSDAQLKSGLPQGFDKKVWKEKSDINNGYPYLTDNLPPK